MEYKANSIPYLIIKFSTHLLNKINSFWSRIPKLFYFYFYKEVYARN
ncbi:hypothetical protein HPMG_00467 [Helicobacter pullorum MIT 98-5489]|uniref:Uncharacterized protein n=1 Tax=Helicobacter pullorum MIT 98-5489 TaxID=537972 RepID=C5EXJ9_9HELI|nr:hypothetical protein HPMG_00467 [Helicobacter pullorum MIT 98-5489]